MWDFFTHLFDVSGFPPRWHCGEWTAGHGWLHILSDLGVWSAYIAIPCVLGFFVLRKRDLPFRTIFWLFGAFILACGTTHLMEAIIFWWPAYRLAGVFKLCTAAISWTTVFALVPLVPKALLLRSPGELECEIAERKRTEASLRQSEERFRSLVEGTTDYAIFLLDPRGHVVTWNGGAERIKRYRAEDIIGKHFSCFYPEAAIARRYPEHELEVAGTVGRFEDEGWRVRQDGSRFWANVVLTALRDETGGLIGFSKITRDLSERKQAEDLLQQAKDELEVRVRERTEELAQANAALQMEIAERRRVGQELRESEGRVRSILEFNQAVLANMGEGLYAVDTAGKVTYLNPAAEKLLGWASADLLGRRMHDLTHYKHLDGSPFPASACAGLQVLQKGTVLTDHEDVFIRQDGSFFPVTFSASPLVSGGRTTGLVVSFRDITAQKQAQETLRESERRYRALAEALPQLVWTDLPDGTCDYLSSQWGDYTGIPVDELLGFRWLELLHPEDRERTLQCWRTAVADQGDYDLEYRIRRHDGQYRWFKTRGVPLRDPEGHITRWFGTCTDIEDQKRDQEALQVSETKYRNLFENMAEEVHFWQLVRNEQGGILTWRLVDANPPALRSWGRSLDEIRGKTADEIFGAGSTDHYMAVVRKIMVEGTAYAFEDYFPKLEKHFRFTSVPLGDYFITTGADITALKQAHEMLQRTHEELDERVRERTADLAAANRALQARAGQQAMVARFGQRALAGTDLVALTTEAAAAVAEALGIEYSRVMELLPDGDGLVLRGGVGWSEGTVGKTTVGAGQDSQSGFALLDNEPVLCADWRTEARFRRPKLLEDHGVVCSIAVVIPGAERPYGVLGADSTRNREFSDDDRHFLQAVAHVLATAIERKQAEGRAAAFAAELQRSNRELEQFASIASHDLQEPLRKIQTFGDRLQARCGEAVGEHGRQYIERMQSSATRMRTLIEDLLTYSRVTSKAQPFVEVDLATEVRHIVSDLEGRIHETGGRVEVGELPTLQADATQMRQLFQNLIANALKFHKPGEPPVVTVTARVLNGPGADGPGDVQDGTLCRITVTDNGIGFEEEYAERIFQLFQRLHGRNEYEGTGIGLAICKKIVERHGGAITAASAPGQGAAFIITLPLKHSEDETP